MFDHDFEPHEPARPAEGTMTPEERQRLDELRRLAQERRERGFVRRTREVEDFRYDETQNKFWDVTTGKLLTGNSVNGAVPQDRWPTRPDRRNGDLRRVQPSKVINDVDTGLTVEDSTWWPGQPQFIENVVVTDRGARRLKGAVTYNSYVPPDHSALATHETPQRWLEHVERLYPDPAEREHFFDWVAYMIQRPDEKVNHGIVMAGAYGIGKDTALEPVRRGVGEWNAAEIPPDQIGGPYNPYVKSKLLVINEVRPHDEDHKASNFYNQIKPLMAAPPDMIGMEVKYANTIYVRNLVQVLLTTNDPLTMYIPPDDRRLFVMTSPLLSPRDHPGVFPDGYFDGIWAYFDAGGSDAVVRWLLARDIRRFKPGAPPPMTVGKQRIIDSAHQVRRTVADELIERYIAEAEDGRPQVIFARELHSFVEQGFDDRDDARKAINGRSFHYKMSEHGYDMVRNPNAKSWKHGKVESRVAFVDKTVPPEDQVLAVEKALPRLSKGADK